MAADPTKLYGILDKWPFVFEREGDLVGTVIEEEPKLIRWAMRKGMRLDEQASDYLRECERDA